MRADFFKLQVERLKRRFGEKNFDDSFIEVVGREVSSVSDEFFRSQVDTWIGTRKTHNPPLLAEFRECREAYTKSRFESDVKQATKHVWGDPSQRRETLRKEYKVDSVMEAFELMRLKTRLGDRDGEGSK